MYRKIRIILATFFFVGITLLLAGFGNVFGGVLDFMPKLQFLPAVLAMNFGFILVVVVVTLLFGRIYCSVICPLGVFQDVFSHFGKTLWWKKKKKRNNRYVPERKWIRYGVFGVFIVSLLAGFQLLVLLLAPYSLYGRFIHSLLHSYSWVITLVSVGTVVLIAFLAFWSGRTWCNTICPVGTALSFMSRFSLFRPVIDTEHCISCRKCEKNCKANCIDIKHHQIDYSRCVDCFDCLDQCKFDALHYQFAYRQKSDKVMDKKVADVKKKENPMPPDISRRAFLVSSILAGGAVMDAAADDKLKFARRKKAMEAYKDYKSRPKVEPERLHPITPPGSLGGKHFYDHCTACHLCIISCPEQIIRPALSFDHFMQPELTYANKVCNPECNRCSQVCPAGAILPYPLEEKKKHPAGLAVVDLETCLFCGKCSKVCPYGAITMVVADPAKPRRRKPVVNPELCVGCGACELNCPVRPVSAIHVEGLL